MNQSYNQNPWDTPYRSSDPIINSSQDINKDETLKQDATDTDKSMDSNGNKVKYSNAGSKIVYSTDQIIDAKIDDEQKEDISADQIKIPMIDVSLNRKLNPAVKTYDLALRMEAENIQRVDADIKFDTNLASGEYSIELEEEADLKPALKMSGEHSDMNMETSISYPDMGISLNKNLDTYYNNEEMYYDEEQEMEIYNAYKYKRYDIGQGMEVYEKNKNYDQEKETPTNQDLEENIIDREGIVLKDEIIPQEEDPEELLGTPDMRDAGIIKTVFILEVALIILVVIGIINMTR